MENASTNMKEEFLIWPCSALRSVLKSALLWGGFFKAAGVGGGGGGGAGREVRWTDGQWTPISSRS